METLLAYENLKLGEDSSVPETASDALKQAVSDWNDYQAKQTEAEEAMQDSFLKIFTRLDQYHDGQCFEAWMHRIAIHTAIDYVRRQAPDQEELSDNLAEPETDGPDEEEIQYSVAQIKEATKKLPAGYRIILSLYLFEGYDMEEIASILKIQPPSVRSQYLRAKRKLLDIIAAN